jgi:uncharacterized protein (DUF4415 family)
MKEKFTSNTSQTDWAHLDAMQDTEIDLSDAPEITPEMFAKAVVKHGLKPGPAKKLLTLRVDDDVLAWFRSQGRGYQTRINTLLRAYMDANREQRRRVKTTIHKTG